MGQCCPTLCGASNKNQWALKGDARVFGFATSVETPLYTGDAVPLSATECGATIHGGTNAGFTGTTCLGISTNDNCGVDNATSAHAQGFAGTTTLSFSPSAPASLVQTSLEPLFINCCDINFQRTKGLSNKVFAALNYNWPRQGWTPYVGVGGSAEFGNSPNNDCNNSCNSSTTTTPATSACPSEPCDTTSCCNQCVPARLE